jgi:hypothetical protein
VVTSDLARPSVSVLAPASAASRVRLTSSVKEGRQQRRCRHHHIKLASRISAPGPLPRWKHTAGSTPTFLPATLTRRACLHSRTLGHSPVVCPEAGQPLPNPHAGPSCPLHDIVGSLASFNSNGCSDHHPHACATRAMITRSIEVVRWAHTYSRDRPSPSGLVKHGRPELAHEKGRNDTFWVLFW